MHKLITLLVGLVLVGTGLNPAYADGGEGKGNNSPLAPFQKLISDENYQQAITELDKGLQDDPENADLLNLKAYSHRKLKQFDVALEYYQKALQIEPQHLGANEYLGELYLQTGQLDKAEVRLEVLDDACFFGCGEYDELEEAIVNYRKQNPS